MHDYTRLAQPAQLSFRCDLRHVAFAQLLNDFAIPEKIGKRIEPLLSGLLRRGLRLPR